MFSCNRDGNYAQVLGSLFKAMKRSRLSAVFFKLAAVASPPPQNLAAVLLSLAEYCLAAGLADDCRSACQRITDIGNGQQREAAKELLAQLRPSPPPDSSPVH